jgi:Patatin-like phospholipase
MSDRVSARIWVSDGFAFEFPEQAPGRLPKTANSGVCFSGGGMRSLTATMGQLRGLTKLGLIPHIRYNSCVSGGARAGIAYTYYRRGARDDQQFLGPLTPPDCITWTNLAKLDPGCLGSLATKDPTATMFFLQAKGVNDHQLWTSAAGIQFLAPFGLYDPYDPGFFALDKLQVGEIQHRNPSLRDTTFYTVRTQEPRPYLIAHGAFVAPVALSPFKEYRMVDAQYTPLYVGTPFALNIDYVSIDGRREERRVGGGFLESFAFGSPGALGAVQDGLIEVTAPARPFELADVSGTATASFSGTYHNFLGEFSPQQPYWSVAPEGQTPSTPFYFGDGGIVDNYGILALLQRRVKNIAVFINTGTRLNLEYDPSQPPTEDDVDFTLPTLFGYPKYYQQHNQVFAKSRWAPLIRELQAARIQGRTVMTRTELEVFQNDWWGIEGGWTVRVLWVYNARVRDWEERLRPDTGIREAIDVGYTSGEGPFANFPTYLVNGQNEPGSLALTPEQINLLADLSCWNVTENAQVFEDLLTGL